ncbi:CLM5 protein, partial [Formicarius rufipectus]|nr:CLM5 protein [Formicarius rufipectus]
LQAQAPHVSVRQREGSTLYIQCPYTPKASYSWKEWCRLKGGQCHDHLVSMSPQDLSKTEDRIGIKDDRTAKTVSVTMTGLKTEDSGTYLCAYYNNGYSPLKAVSLNVFKAHILGVLQGPSSTQPRSQATSLSNVNTFILLSVVLAILLILALLTLVTLCVRLHMVLKRTGNQEAEDIYDNSQGTAQLGSNGRRGSSKDDIKGPKYINLDLQSHPRPEDPLYCNIEPSQAQRNPQGGSVDYAVIAFNQCPRNDSG